MSHPTALSCPSEKTNCMSENQLHVRKRVISELLQECLLGVLSVLLQECLPSVVPDNKERREAWKVLTQQPTW